MGAKTSKIEGSYLPDTPTLKKLQLANIGHQEIDSTPTQTGTSDLENKDPRSPNGCRTPLNFLQQQTKLAYTEQKIDPIRSDNAFAQLRKRFLKGFAFNDPRSPQLNRTPLVFDEALDRTLNMDDTFADLFVDTRVPNATQTLATTIGTTTHLELLDLSSGAYGTPVALNNSSLEIVSLPYDEEETMACDVVLQQTPEPHQQTYDPRSPSIGVERTPIIFCDDDEDEAREDQMLEQVLETLTLNLSNESSVASFVSAAAELSLDELQPRLANKHLDRVRLGNKKRVPPRKPARASKLQTPQRVFVDEETPSHEAIGGGATSTPKSTPSSGTKRTPLSCVKNRAHLRSRSVDKDLLKTRLPLKSFDDQLNPTERLRIPRLRLIMANGKEINIDESKY